MWNELKNMNQAREIIERYKLHLSSAGLLCCWRHAMALKLKKNTFTDLMGTGRAPLRHKRIDGWYVDVSALALWLVMLVLLALGRRSAVALSPLLLVTIYLFTAVVVVAVAIFTQTTNDAHYQKRPFGLQLRGTKKQRIRK